QASCMIIRLTCKPWPASFTAQPVHAILGGWKILFCCTVQRISYESMGMGSYISFRCIMSSFFSRTVIQSDQHLNVQWITPDYRQYQRQTKDTCTGDRFRIPPARNGYWYFILYRTRIYSTIID